MFKDDNALYAFIWACAFACIGLFITKCSESLENDAIRSRSADIQHTQVAAEKAERAAADCAKLHCLMHKDECVCAPKEQ